MIEIDNIKSILITNDCIYYFLTNILEHSLVRQKKKAILVLFFTINSLFISHNIILSHKIITDKEKEK